MEGAAVNARQTRAQRLLLAGVVLAYWGASLAVGFFLDDVHNLESALDAGPDPHALANAFTVFDPRSAQVWCLDRQALHFFRPLLLLSLELDYLVWGAHAAGFHATNLALHVANAWMLHALLLRLRLPPPRALAAAAVFAAFPHHTVAVIWISGRTELLLAAFLLASLVLHARAIQERSGTMLALSCISAVLALLTKEGAVALPAYLATVEWALRPSGEPARAWLRRAALRLLPATALAAAFGAWRLLAFGQVGTPPAPYYVSPLDPAFPAFFAIKAIYYAFAWLTTFPVMPVAPVAFLFEHPVVLAVLALATLIGWALVIRRVREEPSFWPLLAWAGICQLPVAMLMSSNHYMYMGNAAVAAVFALLLPAGGWRVRAAAAGIAVLFGAHAAQGIVGYHRLSAQERALAEAVRHAAPETMQPGSDLYIANAPLVAAHVGQRLRVLEGATALRPHMLTVSADPFAVAEAPQARWEGDRTLVLEKPGGLLPGPMGELFRMMGVQAEPGREYAAGPATVRPSAGPDGAVDRVSVRFEGRSGAQLPSVILFRPGRGGAVEAVRLDPRGEQIAAVEP